MINKKLNISGIYITNLLKLIIYKLLKIKNLYVNINIKLTINNKNKKG